MKAAGYLESAQINSNHASPSNLDSAGERSGRSTLGWAEGHLTQIQDGRRSVWNRAEATRLRGGEIPRSSVQLEILQILRKHKAHPPSSIPLRDDLSQLWTEMNPKPRSVTMCLVPLWIWQMHTEVTITLAPWAGADLNRQITLSLKSSASATTIQTTMPPTLRTINYLEKSRYWINVAFAWNNSKMIKESVYETRNVITNITATIKVMFTDVYSLRSMPQNLEIFHSPQQKNWEYPISCKNWHI